MEISGLDQTDNKIVEMLSKDARISYSDIGKAVGKSRVAVKTRIKQLEQKGIIRGYYADIDTGADPKGIHFTLDVETDPQQFGPMLDRLAVSRMISQLYSTSGECHIFAIGFAPNSETLGSFARHLQHSVRGVRRLSWRILVAAYKDTQRGVDYELQYKKLEHMEEPAGQRERE